MPFKSEQQRRFMWARHPEIAEQWAHGRHTSGRSKGELMDALRAHRNKKKRRRNGR